MNQVTNKLLEKKIVENSNGQDSIQVSLTLYMYIIVQNFAFSLLLFTYFTMMVSMSWHCCCTYNVEQLKLHYIGLALHNTVLPLYIYYYLYQEMNFKGQHSNTRNRFVFLLLLTISYPEKDKKNPPHYSSFCCC